MPAALRTLLVRLLAAAAIAALAWSAAVWASGGWRVTIGGVHVSATDIWRPFAVAALAAAIATALHGVNASRASLIQAIARVTPRRAALALAAGVLIVGVAKNSWTASGADGFAYVSHAALWRQARLDIPVPLATDVPWPDNVRTFTPFGYRPAPNGSPRIVPITAPGVPMVMALFQRVGGYAAAFLVAPMSGGLLVVLSFAIGRRAHSSSAGVIAAWLVATSPTVLYMSVWPMSDLPAAACAAGMMWLLLSPSPGSSGTAGLVASLGLLTRPNFAIIAGAALLWLLMADWRRAGWFVAGLIPGAVVMAGLNVQWFGSALATGYGTAGGLIDVSRVSTNATRFARWLAETSPLAWLGIAALIATTRLRDWSRGPAGLFRLVATASVSVYLVYDVHEEWWYLRFLLPAWPALFVPAAIALDSALARGRAIAVIVVAIVIAAGVGGLVTAQARGAFSVGEGERRYVSVARLVDQATEPDAVIITSQHAGTVWWYAGRTTIRYDTLDPAWLDRAVAWLASHQRHPYILVEDWEHPLFEARFKTSNRDGDLSYSPMVAWQSLRMPGWTWLYDPLDRRRPTSQPGPALELTQPRCARPKRVILSQ